MAVVPASAYATQIGLSVVWCLVLFSGGGGSAATSGAVIQLEEGSKAEIALVAAPVALRRGCLRAARRLGVAVYCPTRVPRGWAPAHLCAGCNGTFSATGWFRAPRGYVGQPGERTGHFTVWAARPAQVRQGYVGCVDGTMAGRVRVGGHAALWVVCPPGSTLDAGHVLLRWSRREWLYAVSLHADTAVNRSLLRRIAARMTVVQR